MNFNLTPEQEQIRDAIEKICAPFDDDYWLRKDRDGGFPARFPRGAGRRRLARHRHAGGVWRRRARHHRGRDDDADHRAIRRRAVGRLRRAHEHLRAASGRGVRHRRAEAALAAAADRRARTRPASRVTEPNAGLNTRKLKTRAVREGDHYVVHGPEDLDLDRAGRRTRCCCWRAPRRSRRCKRDRGAEPFYTDLDRTHVEVREIEKMGRKAVDSNQLFIDGLRDPGRGPHRRGRQGLQLHPARAQPRAHPDRRRSGRPRPRRAAARRRLCAASAIVFGRPIGQNQAIQHPLAESLDGARGRQPDGA